MTQAIHSPRTIGTLLGGSGEVLIERFAGQYTVRQGWGIDDPFLGPFPGPMEIGGTIDHTFVHPEDMDGLLAGGHILAGSSRVHVQLDRVGEFPATIDHVTTEATVNGLLSCRIDYRSCGPVVPVLPDDGDLAVWGDALRERGLDGAAELFARLVGEERARRYRS